MQTKELSYFRLNLLAFLQSSHPEKVNDTDLIDNRSQQALSVYEETIKGGSNTIDAEEVANELLFKGLQFSRYDTFVEVLWNEFPEYVNENETLTFAKKMLPQCEEIFSSYPLDDDFAYSAEYDNLYTELTGWFQQWIEDYELQ